MIYWELFWSFFQVGVFCVGGGYASMPLIETQVVQLHGWLTLQEFIDIFTISQMTPGPIGINAATFVGQRVAGFFGAVCATCGFVTPSLLIILLLSYLLKKYGDIAMVKGILNGLRPAVVAFIACAAVSFVMLVIWNKEVIPDNLEDVSMIGCILLPAAMIAAARKENVFKLLLISGAIGLALGILGLK